MRFISDTHAKRQYLSTLSKIRFTFEDWVEYSPTVRLMYRYLGFDGPWMIRIPVSTALCTLFVISGLLTIMTFEITYSLVSKVAKTFAPELVWTGIILYCGFFVPYGWIAPAIVLFFIIGLWFVLRMEEYDTELRKARGKKI